MKFSKVAIVLFLFLMLIHTLPAAEIEKDPFKTIQEVVKEAEKKEGLFTLYQTREGKVYLEIKNEQFKVPYLFTMTLSQGIGAHGILTGTTFDDFIFNFVRVNDDVLLIKKNPYFKADPDSTDAKVVQADYSESIVSSFKIAAVQPEDKSVLIEIDDLFLSDLPDFVRTVNQSLRGSYSLDSSKSYFKDLSTFPENIEIEASVDLTSSAPPKDASLLEEVPDWRSISVGVHYSLSSIPKANYVPRLSDDRIGYFVTAIKDFSKDDPETAVVRYITRWDLSKKPIVFWIENTTPKEYREAIRSGILEWNIAFEKLGIHDAIQVEVQPEDAKWNPFDIRYNLIHWIDSSEVSFAAVGPSHVNPLTGEIYNASVLVEGEAIRRIRLIYKNIIELPTSSASLRSKLSHQCLLPLLKTTDAQIAALGLTLNNQPYKTPESFVNAYVKDLVMHEFGHCLGLRHNFHGSTLLSLKELSDPKVTKKFGLSSSVMDYLPVNITSEGSNHREYFSSTLGPYDYWAIQYGYLPTQAKSPEEEEKTLKQVASQSSMPQYAYATDEDIYGPYAIDPHALAFDLSNDPLSFAVERFKLYRKVIQSIGDKLPKPGEGFDQVRRAFDLVLPAYTEFADIPIRYIGGKHFSRSHKGDPGSKGPLRLVDKQEQLKALTVLDTYFFKEGAFYFPPILLSNLAPERYSDHFSEIQPYITSFDYPMVQKLSDLQEELLSELFRPVLLNRLVENTLRVTSDEPVLTIDELFNWMTDHFLEEIKHPRPISPLRRALQRSYLFHLAELAIDPKPQMFSLPDFDFGPTPVSEVPGDARSLAEHHLRIIQNKIHLALENNAKKFDTVSLAHLRSSMNFINHTLTAKVQRPLTNGSGNN